MMNLLRSKKIIGLLLATGVFMGCQDLTRPELGTYLKDTNPVGGPLKFYAAFDGTTSNVLMNAVDSIRATFPGSNPLKSIDGIRGKAVQGENKLFLKYAKPNDFAKTASSFAISYWYKHDGQTLNNVSKNGPEYPLSFKSSNGHWSGGSFFVIMEGDNKACAVKVMIADAKVADNWFTWEGGNTIAGLMDNKWHNIVLSYDATTSGLTLYVDGVANAIVPKWTGHGAINMDDATITEMRVGAGPGDSIDTDDWLSCTWKGGLDQLRFYNTAFSATDAQTLFAAKK